MWVTSSLTTVLTPTAVALGNFDGVHRGHQQVVKPVLLSSEAFNPIAASSREGQSWAEEKGGLVDTASKGSAGSDKLEAIDHYRTVVTFNPHPREFFTGQTRTLLTPLLEKVTQLRRLGVEQLVLLPFDRELASLSPQQFVEQILVRQLQVRRVSVGEDFRFGRKRAGTSEDLRAIAATYGVEVTVVSLQKSEGERISSSAIRQALLEGSIERANQLLGRSYTLSGKVVQGQQLGRKLGFPTANLQLPPSKFLPCQGVYAVQVFIEEQESVVSGDRANEEAESSDFEDSKIQNSLRETENPIPYPGVANIGCRPTVNGTTPTVEVHLLDWTGDLYGKTLTVSLEKFLRPEQKFASLEALKQQIQIDCAVARDLLMANC